jgi:RimJ/RimL family protein N-acetyltransferase
MILDDNELLDFVSRCRGLDGMPIGDAFELLNHYTVAGPSWLYRDPQGILQGAGGGIKLRKGVVWVWILTTEEIKKNRKGMVKAIKNGLKEMQTIWKPHRVEAECLESNEVYNEFLKYMGFKRESLMTAYGPNKEDYIRYVIINMENGV